MKADEITDLKNGALIAMHDSETEDMAEKIVRVIDERQDLIDALMKVENMTLAFESELRLRYAVRETAANAVRKATGL